MSSRREIPPFMGRYTLLGTIPVPCLDLMTWGRWLETNFGKRRVASNHLKAMLDGEEIDIHVSTVFLALDQSFGDSDPVLFETMVFGGPHGGELRRYSTWAEAEDGHREWLQRELEWLGTTEEEKEPHEDASSAS